MPILSEEQINQIVDEIKEDERVVGILLTGSYVYGEPNEKSDLDVRCITDDESNWAEIERMRFGTRIEVFFNPPSVVMGYMDASRHEGHGDCIHFWAHGKIVFDPNGAVKKLQDEAMRLWKDGPTPGKEWAWRWAKHQKYNGTYGQT